MSIRHISPADANALLSEGAILVDIREKDEYLRESIPDAHHHALSGIERNAPKADGTVIFHCRSGNRTMVNAAKLAAAVPKAKAYLLEGGIEAWRDAGLPTRKDPKQPLELMRQVQIGAGSLVLAGFLMGMLAHSGFHIISAFVGAGLIFAGATGFCGLARILGFAPWNRRLAASVS